MENESIILNVDSDNRKIEINLLKESTILDIISDLIDKNINVVENRIMSQLLETFRKYEPRALLKTTQIIMKDKHRNEFEITLGIEVIEIE